MKKTKFKIGEKILYKFDGYEVTIVEVFSNTMVTRHTGGLVALVFQDDIREILANGKAVKLKANEYII